MMSSIIQEIITGGNMVYWNDFRSESYEDLSGNAHTVTAVNSPVFTGEGIQFDGSTNYLAVADAADLSFGNGTTDSPFSLASWINIVDDGDNHAIITKRFTTPSNASEYIFQVGGTDFINVVLSDASTGQSVARTQDSAYSHYGEWAHVVMTYDGTGGTNGGDGITIYVNGVVVASTATSNASYTAMENKGSDVHIGRTQDLATHFLNGQIQDAMIISRELTASEVAQLMQETNDLKWNSKTESKKLANVSGNTDDTSLVASWVMKPQGGVIVDEVAGQNGTITGGATGTHTPFRDGIFFDGADDEIDVSAYDLSSLGTSNFSMSFWVNPVNIASADTIFSNQSGDAATGFSLLGTASTDDIKVFSADTNITTSAGLPDNTWNHVVVVRSASSGAGSVKVYVNNVEEDSGDANDLSFSSSGTEYLGSRNGTRFFNGTLSGVKFWNKALSTNEISRQYAVGANAIQYKTDFGVKESVANVTAGELEDSGWTVSDGTWQISTDTIGGRIVKVLNCIASGLIYIPIDQFMEQAEAAYGSWEFWLNKPDAVSCDIGFGDVIGGRTGVGQDGYFIRVDSSEVVSLRESTNGSSSTLMATVADTSSVATWDRFKLTRNGDGQFTVYLNGTAVTADSGSNPVTDNTTTSAKYLLLDLGIGSKISFGTKNGDNALTKYLGII